MKRLVFILADPRRKSGALVKEEFGYSSHPFTASDIGDGLLSWNWEFGVRVHAA